VNWLSEKLSQKVKSPNYYQLTITHNIHQVSNKKLCQRYFLNNSVKHWPICIISGMQHYEETWRKWL